VNALSWILFAACCAVCFAIGWAARGWRQEIAEFREEDRRNAAWDRDYQRGTTLNVDKPIIPVASASSEPATPPPPLDRDQSEEQQ
jgi:hypothetical protein